MSTKIYNGFYLDVPIEKAIPILKDIKTTMEPMMTQRAKDAMCSQLAELCFDALEGKPVKPAPPEFCLEARKDYLESLLQEKQLLNWAACFVEMKAEEAEHPSSVLKYDEDCCVLGKVVLFPCGKRTYGIAYGTDDFCKAFLEMPQVHEFAFWNNADKPADVSDEEWMDRGNIWEELLPSFWAADDGFTYTLFNAQRLPFDPLAAEDMDAWLKKNRAGLVSRRAKFLLREKLAESTPQGEMNALSYALHLDKLARQEIKEKTNLSAWAISKVAEEIPLDYSGVLRLLS